MSSSDKNQEQPLPSLVQLALPASHAVLPAFNRSLTGETQHFHTTTYLPSSSSGDFTVPSPVPSLDPTKPFVAHHPSFLALLGPNPTFAVLAEDRTGKAFAHEAPVFEKETNTVIFSSSPYGSGYDTTEEISRVDLNTGEVRPVPGSDKIITPNGAIRFGDKIVFCSQGVGEDKQPGGLITIDRDGNTEVLVNNFYGRKFNSPNDVAILPPPTWTKEKIEKERGAKLGEDAFTTAGTELHGELGTTIFWTDPTYAYRQSFKAAPELPNQVYAYNTHTKSVRCVADGFDMPNGICFNLEGTICYITDTGMVSEEGPIKRHRPGTIYAYDVVQPGPGADLTLEGPILTNRRVFCFVDGGIPDGVKCDRDGNVFTGCLDGLHIYHRSGTLIGRITFFPDPTSAFPELTRYCANFCLVPGGIVMMAEDRIYIAKIGEHVKGALL